MEQIKGVKIMTVHKSKGLEFENVIVCDKMGAGRHDGSNFVAEYDADTGSWQVRHNVKKQCIDEDLPVAPIQWGAFCSAILGY